MNLFPFASMWVLMATTVIALFVWRKMVASKEDDNLHLVGGASAEKTAQQQAALAQKLELIDKWGKIVTVLTVVYGLVLCGFYAWQIWIEHTYTGA